MAETLLLRTILASWSFFDIGTLSQFWQACAESMHIEKDCIEEGIVEFVSQQRIGRLVMGAAADSRFSRCS